MNEASNLRRILSLDEGGAKGFYTLGVLAEVEAVLPRPIHETFDIIFGTSTGSVCWNTADFNAFRTAADRFYRQWQASPW